MCTSAGFCSMLVEDSLLSLPLKHSVKTVLHPFAEDFSCYSRLISFARPSAYAATRRVGAQRGQGTWPLALKHLTTSMILAVQ